MEILSHINGTPWVDGGTTVSFAFAFMRTFDDLSAKTSHNVRYFAYLFGGLTLFSYFCRRICDVNCCIMSRKVRIRYVYTRKRQLDGLPLGHF